MPTFLYTDIEGSTQLWENHGQAMGAVLARHDEILSDCIKKCGGRLVKGTGDGMLAVFEENEVEPLECALVMQRRLAAEPWPEIDELRIRVAVHAGPAEYREGDYYGPVVNRVARLMSTAWGGQIVLTPEVKSMAPLPNGASLQDLGVHLLKDLSEPQRVFGLVHADLQIQEFPALRSMSSQPNNLPRQPTALVGRVDELDEIGELLSNPECRLLSLVAPGGMGKTRLGLQAAAEQIDHFPHGVFFVPLAGVASPDNIPSTIANSLKLSFYGLEDLESQLHNYLSEKQLLLLLDNFEHLIEGAGIAADILASAPKVKILVTSRQQLRLQAEWTLDVHGLPVPTNGASADSSAYSSVELFLQSARRVQPGFSPSTEDIRAIFHICRLVDGMPLALELAAAWVKTLSCTEIAAEIKQDFDLLETEMQDIPKRQRSVRAIFEHSWNDLSERVQSSFAKLSVFRGGFTRKAAQEVTGASLRDISELTNKSLLIRNSDGRYQVHELLRQFAAEKLAEDEGVCRGTQERQATFFANFLKGIEESLIKGSRSEPVEKIKVELDNVVLAWKWAIDQGSLSLIDDGMRSLFWFYEANAWYSEGEEAFKAAAQSLSANGDLAGEDKDNFEFLLTNLLVRQAWFATRLSRYREAKTILEGRDAWFAARLAQIDDVQTLPPEETEMALADNDPEGFWVNAGVEVNALYGLGNYEGARRYLEWYDGHFRTWPWANAQTKANLGRIAGAMGEYEKARRLLRDGLEILKPLGDQVSVMLYLHTLGGIVQKMGNSGEAKKLFQEGLDLAQSHNHPMGKVLALGDLGDLAYREGEYGSAKDYFELSLTLSEDIGDNRGRALAFTNLGRIATALGDFEEARLLYEQGLEITARAGNRRGTASTLNRLSQVHRLLGHLEQAGALCQESWDICRDIGYRKGAILAQITHGELALERTDNRTAGQDFQESLEASEGVGFVSGIMRSQIGLGRLALRMNDLARADTHLRKGLAAGAESQQKRAEMIALLALARTLIAAGNTEKGVELLALAANHPAADYHTKKKASRELGMLKDSFSPTDFENLIALGQDLTVDIVRATQYEI